MYYVNYKAISLDGWAIMLCTASDFRSVSRQGIIFYPPDKDVGLFPEKINGRYWALHRQHNEGFGKPSIWISSSPESVGVGTHPDRRGYHAHQDQQGLAGSLLQ